MNFKINLKYSQIQKWMLHAGRAEKEHEQNDVICVVFMFPSWVMILQLSKKCFLQFDADLSKKNKLNQFTYMHLKRLVTCFQKILLFTMLWLNFLNILVFEIKVLC